MTALNVNDLVWQEKELYVPTLNELAKGNFKFVIVFFNIEIISYPIFATNLQRSSLDWIITLLKFKSK